MINKNLEKHSTTFTKRDDEFIEFCHMEYLSTVRYLLTSAELKEHANINIDND